MPKKLIGTVFVYLRVATIRRLRERAAAAPCDECTASENNVNLIYADSVSHKGRSKRVELSCYEIQWFNGQVVNGCLFVSFRHSCLKLFVRLRIGGPYLEQRRIEEGADHGARACDREGSEEDGRRR